MSSAVFPVLPGLKWDVTRTPQFETRVQRAVAGYETRLGLMSYPLWTFSMGYELLRDNATLNELKTLAGFFLARRGSHQSFLYSDPDDYAQTDYQFGTGDGNTTAFQLYRDYGSFQEPVENVHAITNIKVGGNTTANYSLGNTGIVTFTSAPASNAALTWTGTFYHRCRFSQDAAEFNKFMTQLWELRKISFIGSPMNKV